MNAYEKPDFYSRKAKSEGYLARSVYKLTEIDQKFRLIRPNMKIIDLGCAPGSWSQYISSKVGKNGLLIGIDYKEIHVSRDNAIFVQGDFTKPEDLELLRKHAPYDGVVSDMAPDTGGDRVLDCNRSSELTLLALNFAFDFLKPGGFFVSKIFQGGSEKEIMKLLKQGFKEGKWLKPEATRKNSFETFMIGIDFIRKPQIESGKEEYYDEESGNMPW